MKVLKTANYLKIAKDKAEDFDVNPWAVCHTTVDKDKNPDKYERCVKKVKKEHRKKDMKSYEPGGVYSPAVERRDDESGFHTKQKGKQHRYSLPSDKARKSPGAVKFDALFND